MDKKQYLINKIENFEEKYFNKDQKLIAIDILKNAPEEQAQAYFDFISMKRRTGFAFDYSPEIAKGRLITLREDKNRRINVGDEFEENENKLIIGDNYNALKSLLVTHKSRINIIYIDPPYNTEAARKDGNQSSKDGTSSKFIYKDKFGRGGWLNMMKARLCLAKELLTNDGVIFVSIDDSEQAYLKVLMDQIFGEQNSIASIIVQKKSGGGQSSAYYKGHDHLFVYAKEEMNKKQLYVSHENPQYKLIIIKGKKYAYFPDSLRKMHGKFDKSKLKDGELPHRNSFLEDYKITFPIAKQKEIEKKMKNREIIPIFFPPLKANMLCKTERYENVEAKKLLYSIITSWTSKGQILLDSIMNWKRGDKNYFESPKPVSLLKYIIKYNLKKGYILDFFAGSGTTGQAVMELNKEDGGTRKFILITNNENQIAHNVTYERLHRIIKGKATNGEDNFDWIKRNNAYSNESLRVINIDDSIRISLDENVSNKVYDDCQNGLKLLDSNYQKKGINLYYDLAALNPLENDEDKFNS